jgi:peptidoglycan hydrolase CwlO-like protein
VHKINQFNKKELYLITMNDTILLFLSNALTGIAAWFVGKRKTNAETDNLVLSNLEKSMSIYQELIKNLKDEIHELNTKIQELELKVDMLMEENRKLKRKNTTKEN